MAAGYRLIRGEIKEHFRMDFLPSRRMARGEREKKREVGREGGREAYTPGKEDQCVTKKGVKRPYGRIK